MITENAICIVSLHQKGFWMADTYYDGWFEGAVPDWYVLNKTKDGVKDIVKKEFPSIKFEDGVTGKCDECEEQYFLLETICENCEVEIQQY